MHTFAKYQDAILADWDTSPEPMHTILDSSKTSDVQQEFHFIAGPPFPTGKPHLGHVAVETIKSTILNYKSMRGYACENRIGYDCHGLPIESIANRELGIQTREELEAIGLTRFNAFCKDKIASFEGDWEPVYNHLGRWVDFKHTYRTMDKEYMESVWWAFSQLYEKKLIYRGYKITPYSYALQSPLSNFEASQNYKEVDCRSVYVRFLVNDPKISTLLPSHLLSATPTENTLNECHTIDDDQPLVYIIIWTTTPWTLPANLAVCINASLEYDIIQVETGEIYILGKGAAPNIGIKSPRIIATVLGAELVGLSYEPLFDTYSRLYYGTVSTPRRAKWFTILADNYVRPVDAAQPGTGIVHLAPLFGEDDYRVCKEQQIITESDMHSLELIDSSGNITNNHPFADTYDSKHLILDTETDIIKDLKITKALVKIQQIRHEYPYCYRTDTPLIYRACESFYVDIQAIKQRMIELNRGINWIPNHVGSQRFHNWLEGAKDWCISRSRFFGTPIPVWLSEDGSDMQVISSIAQLETLTGVKLDDIHPEYVNHLEFTIGGKRYTRVLDIFDCWFESGAVPFAQYHYPFNPESRPRIDAYVKRENAMCDFIAEGLDQTRGWFYTLLVLSTALFNVAPAKNILTVGLVLDSQKRKISKKLGNYVDVEKLLETHGTDVIRLYILQSGITSAEPMAFREDDLQVITKTLFQFKNCWDFLAEHITHMHHQGYDFNPDAYLEYQQTEVLGAMDKWIIYYMNNLTQELIHDMDIDYNLSKAARAIIDGVENITNWYLKFNRDRLKGKVGVDEWLVSSSILFQVIRKWCILIAPFAPLFSQWIYQQQSKYNTTHTSNTATRWIHQQQIQDAIHLEGVNVKHSLETFNLLQRIARMVRAARMKTTTHTSSKTPIKRLEICMDNPEGLEKIAGCIDLIQSELNVIDIAYASLEGNLTYRVIPNKALLGKKYKKLANDIYKVLESISSVSKINYKTLEPIQCSLANGQEVSITTDEYTLEPVFGDNDIYDITSGKTSGNTSDNELNILVRIDFTYNKEIESLAAMRRFISHVQQSRKKTNLHPWNPISIEINQDDFDVVSSNRDYIQQRLGCSVNTNSLQPSDKIFTLADDDSRVITYMILRL